MAAPRSSRGCTGPFKQCQALQLSQCQRTYAAATVRDGDQQTLLCVVAMVLLFSAVEGRAAGAIAALYPTPSPGPSASGSVVGPDLTCSPARPPPSQARPGQWWPRLDASPSQPQRGVPPGHRLLIGLRRSAAARLLLRGLSKRAFSGLNTGTVPATRPAGGGRDPALGVSIRRVDSRVRNPLPPCPVGFLMSISVLPPASPPRLVLQGWIVALTGGGVTVTTAA